MESRTETLIRKIVATDFDNKREAKVRSVLKVPYILRSRQGFAEHQLVVATSTLQPQNCSERILQDVPFPGQGAFRRAKKKSLHCSYRATFQWEHYKRSLYGSPNLPTATEACASVTSAFLQVISLYVPLVRPYLLQRVQPCVPERHDSTLVHVCRSLGCFSRLKGCVRISQEIYCG